MVFELTNYAKEFDNIYCIIILQQNNSVNIELLHVFP